MRHCFARMASRLTLLLVVGLSCLRAAQAQDLYVSSYDGIRRITPQGEVRPFAIDKQRLGNSMGLAFDSRGNLFVAVFNTSSVMKITSEGKIEEFVTGGLLRHPDALAIDAQDNLYVANNGREIVKISPQGEAVLFADSPLLGFVSGLSFGQDGNLYAVSPWIGSMVRINAEGKVSAFVDGKTLSTPCGAAVSASGNLYTLSGADSLRRITPDGRVQTLTTDASLKGAVHLAFAPSGNLYTVSQGCLRQIAPNGTLHVVARNLPTDARCLAFGAIPGNQAKHAVPPSASPALSTF